MNKQKSILGILALSLFLSLTFASASMNGYHINNSERYSYTQLNQIANRFQENYQECAGNCTFYDDGQLKLQQNQERVVNLLGLKLRFNQRAEYVLNNNGEITQVRQNIWSRIFGQNILR